MNGIPLDPSVPTFTEALRQAGYRTHCCGKIHLRCALTPTGVPVEELDPTEWVESGVMWKSGRIRDLPVPYYGLESVDFVNGHANGSYGHYTRWLREEHPDQAHLFFDAVPLEPPTPAWELYNRRSFKWALPSELHPITYIADRTIDTLNTVARNRAGQGSVAHQYPDEAARPFCLICSIQEPHSPFAPPAEYAYRFDPKDIPPPVGREGELDALPPHFRAMHERPIVTSGNRLQPMKDTDLYYAECAAHYFALIEMLDDQVGRVMGALESSGLSENTVVLFLADHGEALGDHGMWGKGPYHFDSVIRVPFVVAWPARFAAGRSYDGVVSLVDIAPTILDLAGTPIPQGAHPPAPEAPDAPSPWPGQSLLPLLTGEDTSTDGSCVVEMDKDYLGFKMRTLVTQRYRLTCYSGREYGELFDLKEDPDELHNL